MPVGYVLIEIARNDQEVIWEFGSQPSPIALVEL
jgi:hypothetical protein